MNGKWPYFLFDRMQEKEADFRVISVLNDAIAGNEILHSRGSINVPARVNRDVLSHSVLR